MTFCVTWQKPKDADALGYIALHNLRSYMKPCLVVRDLLTRNSNGSQIDWRSFAVASRSCQEVSLVFFPFLWTIMELLKCEWGSCEEKFASPDFPEFRVHVESHLMEIFPKYHRGFSDDTIPDNFACSWRECGWDSPMDAGDLIRHVFFHVFHTRIKLEGFKKQQEMKLAPCALDGQSRNLIPENPEPFLCEWKECNVIFNCPTLFYRHVDSHAMAVDKTLVEVSEDGRKKFSVRCQWEYNPGEGKLRNE